MRPGESSASHRPEPRVTMTNPVAAKPLAIKFNLLIVLVLFEAVLRVIAAFRTFVTDSWSHVIVSPKR